MLTFTDVLPMGVVIVTGPSVAPVGTWTHTRWSAQVLRTAGVALPVKVTDEPGGSEVPVTGHQVVGQAPAAPVHSPVRPNPLPSMRRLVDPGVRQGAGLPQPPVARRQLVKLCACGAARRMVNVALL